MSSAVEQQQSEAAVEQQQSEAAVRTAQSIQQQQQPQSDDDVDDDVDDDDDVDTLDTARQLSYGRQLLAQQQIATTASQLQLPNTEANVTTAGQPAQSVCINTQALQAGPQLAGDVPNWPTEHDGTVRAVQSVLIVPHNTESETRSVYAYRCVDGTLTPLNADESERLIDRATLSQAVNARRIQYNKQHLKHK